MSRERSVGEKGRGVQSLWRGGRVAVLLTHMSVQVDEKSHMQILVYGSLAKEESDLLVSHYAAIHGSTRNGPQVSKRILCHATARSCDNDLMAFCFSSII